MKNTENIPIQYKQYTHIEATITALRLKECREQLNINRQALDYQCQNKKMPSTMSSITSFEQCVRPGQRRQSVKGMSLSTFYELCEFYQVSADYLLGFKESRHRESSADYINSEFGLDDDVLQLLKQMKSHEQLSLSTKYKDFAEIDFFKLFISNFVRNFEIPILEYFNKLSEVEKFNKENTSILNNSGSLHLTKKEYQNKEMVRADMLAETKLNDDIQELDLMVQLARLEVIKNFESFLGKLREQLIK